MKTLSIHLAAVALGVLAQVPLAQGAVAAAPSDHGTPVTEVVVPGGPPPKVTGSYPAENATVPAGTLALKVTFNQPMTPDDWSYGQTAGSAFPKCLGRPRLLSDGRTFVLLCTVLPHKAYGLQINSPRVFANQSGRSASPTLLKFSTAEVGPRDIHDALQQAGLTDADDPVMTWRDSGAGVSRSAPAAGHRRRARPLSVGLEYREFSVSHGSRF